VNKPKFAAWTNENLANFCSESFDEMVQLQDQVTDLKLSLRHLIMEYRKLVMETENARKRD